MNNEQNQNEMTEQTGLARQVQPVQAIARDVRTKSSGVERSDTGSQRVTTRPIKRQRPTPNTEVSPAVVIAPEVSELQASIVERVRDAAIEIHQGNLTIADLVQQVNVFAIQGTAQIFGVDTTGSQEEVEQRVQAYFDNSKSRREDWKARTEAATADIQAIFEVK